MTAYDATRGRFRLTRGTSGAIQLTLKHTDELVVRVADVNEAKDIEELFTRFVDHAEAEAAAERVRALDAADEMGRRP